MARVKKDPSETDVPATQFVESGGVLAVNGKTYAVGLAWAGVPEGTKSAVVVARAAAPGNGADLLCVRKPGRIQYGLGSRSTGHKPGMAPLASFLADILDGNFVGAFETPDGYYVVAIREDQILAGYDQLIADKDHAFDMFHEIFVGSKWAQSAAPKEWIIEGTQANSLEDILTASKPKTVLETVSRKGSILKIAGVAATVIGIYLGWSQYSQWHEQKVLAEQAAQAAEAQRISDEAARTRAMFKVPPMQWEGKPFGAPMIQACADAILKAPITVPGWQPRTVSCVGDDSSPQAWTVAVTFKRDGGTLNWIAPYYNHDGFKPPITQNQAGDAIVSWPLADVHAETFDKSSPTTPSALARRYLSTQFEEVFQPIELVDAAGIPFQTPDPSGRGGPKRNVILEHHLAFSLRTSHDPRDFLQILGPISAMVANSVQLDVPTWTWTIQGTIYEKLPLPKDLQVSASAPPVRR